MSNTVIHTVFKPIKEYFPSWISNPIRSVFTAILTPVMFSLMSGHFLSSFKRESVDRNGDALPWYSYPCIEFLRSRDFSGKRILEFGGGQSTHWWAERAEQVVTFEGNKSWYDTLKKIRMTNVDIYYVSIDSSGILVNQIRDVIESNKYDRFDVIIIDGLFWRKALIPVAVDMISETGVIVCDNADQKVFGFYDGFLDSGLLRVDFVGHAPGTIMPDCTSLYFAKNSFIFHAKNPIPALN